MPDYFRIVLVGLGEQPGRVMARIRDFTGFSLPKTEWFIEHLPLPVLDGLSDPRDIERVKTALEQAGASVHIEPSRIHLPMMVWHPAFDNLAFVSTQFPPKPHSFGWVLDNQLAGMGRPTFPVDLEFLRALHVDLVISLTELPLPEHVQILLESRILHLPVPDLSRPAQEQVEQAVQEIHQTLEGGGKVVVHCGAGMGRTGVILACYLVFTGLSAEDAITEVRIRRPGSIETEDQERCVWDYEKRLRPNSPHGT
ncbi:MAG: dual specificity protein phosphatase family protein [Planctomycetes bacterium]|nr:dual specificity protein phosphatase family protein [Planctomycetota bacterium]